MIKPKKKEKKKIYNLPDKGPASQTKDIIDFDNPIESKYGVPNETNI